MAGEQEVKKEAEISPNAGDSSAVVKTEPNSSSSKASETQYKNNENLTADQEICSLPMMPLSQNDLQLVPVHITSHSYNNSDQEVSQYSSNSSVDSQYSNSYGKRYARHAQHLRAANLLMPEQMSVNIQKNLEHCAQQQRQQFENVVRKY